MGNGLDTQSIVIDDDTILPILVNMKNNNDENNKEINTWHTWSINKIIKRSNFNYELGNKSKTFDKHFGELANFLDNNNLTDKIQDISQTYNKTELTTNLSYDQILSIYLYNQIEKIMNESFNIQSDKWSIYCSYLLSGLSKLPFQYDTVYRSIPQHEYKTGNIIRFNQFLPVSTSQKWFKSGYILEIKNGFRGRDISTFINQKPKTEILFNISNYYMINKIYTSYTNTYISCSEIPIPYSYKTIIWVDDNPENNHKLMQHFESNGIMIIPQLSTKGTIKYLEIISTIINKNILNNLRIISDMHRFEYKYDDKINDKMVDKQAGITLIKELRKRNYLNKICIFTSKQNSNRSVRNINNIYAACEHPNVIVTSKEKVIKRFATFEKMDYKSMEKYVHKCNIFPEAVNGLIIEFLDIKQLILNENICIKLRYNNGDDSFGNFWEESITFNKKIDGKNNDLGNNKRIGIVSHYNIHRMSNEKIFSEKETKFIFEIYYELVPEWMIDFLNCNKNEITQKKIKKISKMECEYINKIDCIKIVCCKKLRNNNKIDEFFRKKILIPCDKLWEMFSHDTWCITEFKIRNKYIGEYAYLTITEKCSNQVILEPLIDAKVHPIQNEDRMNVILLDEKTRQKSLQNKSKKQIETLKSENDKLAKAKNYLTKQANGLKIETDALNADKNGLNEQLKKEQKQCKEANNKMNGLKIEIDGLNHDKNALNKKITELNVLTDSLKGEINELKSKNNMQITQIDKAHDEKKQLNGRIKILEDTNKRIKNETNKKIIELNNELQQNNNNKAETIKTLNNALLDLENEKNEYAKRISILETKNNEYEKNQKYLNESEKQNDELKKKMEEKLQSKRLQSAVVLSKGLVIVQDIAYNFNMIKIQLHAQALKLAKQQLMKEKGNEYSKMYTSKTIHNLLFDILIEAYNKVKDRRLLPNTYKQKISTQIVNEGISKHQLSICKSSKETMTSIMLYGMECLSLCCDIALLHNPSVSIEPLCFEPLNKAKIVYDNKYYIEAYGSEKGEHLNFVSWPGIVRNDTNGIVSKKIAVFKNEILKVKVKVK